LTQEELEMLTPEEKALAGELSDVGGGHVDIDVEVQQVPEGGKRRKSAPEQSKVKGGIGQHHLVRAIVDLGVRTGAEHLVKPKKKKPTA
jgi:hypothetical protein